MKIKLQKVVDVLSMVKVAIASQEVIEQSTCFVFAKGRVFAYNDEIAVSAKSPTNKLKGAVSAKELLALLARSKADMVEIETTENEMRVHAGKRTKAGILLQKEIALPIEELGKPQEWKALPSDFNEALTLCAHSCGRDMSKPALTCIHLSKDIAESCDADFRLTHYQFDQSYFDSEILLPSHAIKEITRYRFDQYALTNGWLHFRIKDVEVFDLIFSVRVFNAKFPDLSRFLKVKGESIKLPDALDAALERCSIFAEADVQKDELVKIRIEDRTVHLRANNEQGWIEDSCRINYKGKKLAFIVNPKILRGSISGMKQATIGKTSMLFTGERFSHIVTLMSGE